MAVGVVCQQFDWKRRGCAKRQVSSAKFWALEVRGSGDISPLWPACNEGTALSRHPVSTHPGDSEFFQTWVPGQFGILHPAGLVVIMSSLGSLKTVGHL